MNPLSSATNIHFIGIGGIGISAVAKMLLLQGKKVSGSDRSPSQITEELIKAGAAIHIGHVKENMPGDSDLVVYTVAIPKDNPEYVEAVNRNLPLLSYPQTLALISKDYFTIAVSGTHGKTTTTAMVATILIEAGLDPTVLVGSLMRDPRNPEQGVNFIPGKGKYFVVEADEYKKSFLNLTPKILVINNLDEDHLDYYQDLADIQNAFLELAMKLGPNSVLIANTNDPHLLPVLQHVNCTVIDYTSVAEDRELGLRVPGAHNRSNARAALAVAYALSIDEEVAVSALQKYEGAWRRFEMKGINPKGFVVYDDYAHNPKKVAAAVAGAREANAFGKLIAVFQPHLYSRTKHHLEEFADSFKEADEVVVLPIYAAREAFDPTVSSEMLVHKINEKGINAVAVKDFSDAESKIAAIADKGDVVLCMGAGDITDLAKKLAIN